MKTKTGGTLEHGGIISSGLMAKLIFVAEMLYMIYICSCSRDGVT